MIFKRRKNRYIKLLWISSVFLTCVFFVISIQQIYITFDKNIDTFKSNNNKMSLTYNSLDNQIIISKNSNIKIDISKIEEEDKYYNKRYTFTLPINCIDSFYNVNYLFNDNYIRAINIVNNYGKTQIVINENAILGYIVSEDDKNIYINAYPPKEVYDKIVVIDPGHGGSDPGTNAFNLYEKDIVFNISKELVSLLQKNKNIKVFITRNTDIKIPLEERAHYGNWLGDLFVSVHINANEYHEDVFGTEVYYYPHDNDNQFNITSEECAKIICDSLSKEINSKNRGEKKENYNVIRNSRIPAVLCEIGFITNKDEAMKLKENDYQEKAALGIYNGIIEIFKTYKPIRK